MQPADASLPVVVSEPGPNPLGVSISVLRALRVRRPVPAPESLVQVDDRSLNAVLDELRHNGVAILPSQLDTIGAHRDAAEQIDPDRLTRDDALAYWLNLYNAGALDLAARAIARGESSVLRVPGGFRTPWARVAREELSLDDIEHGKIRRFGDPRIHGALVCGSASCPTLRHESYRGHDLDTQLDDQLRSFLGSGGAVVSHARGRPRVLLSRVLLWYGADFVRPTRMPTFIPAHRRAIVDAVRSWLPDVAVAALDAGATAGYQPYDWSLACAVG